MIPSETRRAVGAANAQTRVRRASKNLERGPYAAHEVQAVTCPRNRGSLKARKLASLGARKPGPEIPPSIVKRPSFLTLQADRT
jgi:hypothetical protein